MIKEKCYKEQLGDEDMNQLIKDWNHLRTNSVIVDKTSGYRGHALFCRM